MDITIKQTPAEVAALFGAMPSDDQGAFFNALYVYVEREYPAGWTGFCMQMESVRSRPELKSAGETAMRIIGGNY